MPAIHPAPPRPTSLYIVIEIPDDQHHRRALETVCFDKKFVFTQVKHKNPLIHPAPGNCFYKVHYTDPVQLYWLGVACQSLLTQ